MTRGKETEKEQEIVVISDDDDMDIDVDHEHNFNSYSHIPGYQTGIAISHGEQSMGKRNENADKGKGKAIVVEIDDDEQVDMDFDVATRSYFSQIPGKQTGIVIRENVESDTMRRRNENADNGKGKVIEIDDDDDNEGENSQAQLTDLDMEEGAVSALLMLQEESDFPKSKIPGRFEIAYAMITKRAEQKRRVIQLKDIVNWVPCSPSSSKEIKVPSLVNLSIDVLAKNAEKIMSLEHIPDELRYKLSQAVSAYHKMDANFARHFANGSPMEIRVMDGSQLKEEDLLMIFSDFDPKELTLLQLDLCGHALCDEGLRKIVVQSLGILPSLVSVSLKGACRLTDFGLKLLAQSAPNLQSLNLSNSSFITHKGINYLELYLGSNIRELYLNNCQGIEPTLILRALKQFKNLEVLSVADNPTIDNMFVIELVIAKGKNIKELVLDHCVALTNMSIDAVAKFCPDLRALGLSCLSELTDYAMQYLADGCSSIQRLKLTRNNFSDEAVAAFLEASGESLTELSLNSVRRVGPNTAYAISKCSRKLLTLDLSWCRELEDEALGLIVDSCSSLKQLKVFGCSQITDDFINGHSNSKVEIIGLPLTPLKTSWFEIRP